MRGVNKAIIVGNLASDVELRYAANGSAVVNVSVATNESWKDKDGKPQERAEFHRIVMFGKLAEIAGQYLTKGAPAYFEGRLQTRKWQDKSGADRWSTEIIATEMEMLGSKGDNASQSHTERDSGKPAAKPAEDDPFLDIPF